MKKRIVIFIGFVLAVTVVSAQNPEYTAKPKVIYPDQFVISPPVRDIVSTPVKRDSIIRQLEEHEKVDYPDFETALPKGEDQVWQKKPGNSKSKFVPAVNFEGMANGTSGHWVTPPDTQGDVGPNHYVQVVNTSFQVWDKSGNSMLGPIDMYSLWSDFSPTALSDPIVLYDEQADRWFISVFQNNPNNYRLYVGVSQTPDPTGSWYLWKYTWATLPDYPKYGIWQDGYYFGLNTYGYDVGAMDRNAMLSGNASPGIVRFENEDRTYGLSILPFDNDGELAPLGTPGQFIHF